MDKWSHVFGLTQQNSYLIPELLNWSGGVDFPHRPNPTSHQLQDGAVPEQLNVILTEC